MTQALQVVILVVVALGAVLVVMVRGRVRQVVALSAYGTALAVLFRAVRIPDVTWPGLVVGAVALPLILLLTIARMRWRR
jgi:energy-converting hydrogenase B subunit D